MSYVLLSILLYIIDQINPKPLDNPQKYQIIFKTPTAGGQGRRAPHPLLPDRPEGLTQHIDAVSSAVEGIVGHKPSHGETVVIAASSVGAATDALVAALR